MSAQTEWRIGSDAVYRLELWCLSRLDGDERIAKPPDMLTSVWLRFRARFMRELSWSAKANLVAKGGRGDELELQKKREQARRDSLNRTPEENDALDREYQHDDAIWLLKAASKMRPLMAEAISDNEREKHRRATMREAVAPVFSTSRKKRAEKREAARIARDARLSEVERVVESFAAHISTWDLAGERFAEEIIIAALDAADRAARVESCR